MYKNYVIWLSREREHRRTTQHILYISSWGEKGKELKLNTAVAHARQCNRNFVYESPFNYDKCTMKYMVKASSENLDSPMVITVSARTCLNTAISDF